MVVVVVVVVMVVVVVVLYARTKTKLFSVLAGIIMPCSRGCASPPPPPSALPVEATAKHLGSTY
jgi:hypothetical protein